MAGLEASSILLGVLRYLYRMGFGGFWACSWCGCIGIAQWLRRVCDLDKVMLGENIEGSMVTVEPEWRRFACEGYRFLTRKYSILLLHGMSQTLRAGTFSPTPQRVWANLCRLFKRGESEFRTPSEPSWLERRSNPPLRRPS